MGTKDFMTADEFNSFTAVVLDKKHYRDSEHELQCQCVEWFDYQYPHRSNLLFAVPNGGSRNIRTAVKLKKEGVKRGVSDLILLYPSRGFHALCIEMKTTAKGSRQSPEQKDFQKNVEKNGYKYVIIREFGEFQEVVKDYFDETFISRIDYYNLPSVKKKRQEMAKLKEDFDFRENYKKLALQYEEERGND